MTKYLMLALIGIAAQDSKQDQDRKEAVLWSGSVSSDRANAFPKGSSSGNLRFGLIDDADAWAGCWKRIGQAAPAVDFKKKTVLFLCHEKWPGTLKVGIPVVEKGVMTVEVALDDQELKQGKETETPSSPGGMRSVSSRCHYDYSMQALARADLRKIKIINGDKELGEIALAKAK